VSGIIALHFLDGRPVQGTHLEALTTAAAYRGPDGVGRWYGGRVALAHLRHCTTPGADLESQPIADRRANLYVTLDGRVDNREELECDLRRPGEPSLTDAELLLRAYGRWGPECLERVVGDFAFALWDGRRQQLFCARDPLGVRPLYYVACGGMFVAASGLRELVEFELVPRDINEGMAGELLTGDVYSTSETLYRHVARLAPGHQLTVDARGARAVRYWAPRGSSLRSLPAAEYPQRFLELFRQAVACRARSDRTIAADLSGGLDSSSVVSTLARLASQGALAQPFAAFSLTFPGKPCDETEYARHVANVVGCSWNRVVVEPLPASDYLAMARRDHDFPGYPNGAMAAGAVQRLRSKRIGVLLTGVGGDEWLAPAPRYARCLDLAQQGRFSVLAATLGEGAALSTAQACLRQIALRTSIKLGIEAPLRARFRARLPKWLNPGFVRRTALLDRMAVRPCPFSWEWSRRARWLRGTAPWNVHALEVEERFYAAAGVEVRHPFLDRRLVEFVLSIPEDEMVRDLGHKAILRRSMEGIVPEWIRTRRTKVEFSHLFRETLGEPAVGRAFRSWQGDGRPDWVLADRAVGALNAYLQGDPGARPWSLWALYGLDAWLLGATATPATERKP
jgi:asparagine synthase (glutamine-hydrolysing)